jgi:hypothetical protein
MQVHFARYPLTLRQLIEVGPSRILISERGLGLIKDLQKSFILVSKKCEFENLNTRKENENSDTSTHLQVVFV